MESYTASLAELARRARRLRILRNLQQRELAVRAGVGIGTIVRFEHSGRVSSENLVRIAVALGAEGGLDKLFELPKYSSLDDALRDTDAPERQRVRRRR